VERVERLIEAGLALSAEVSLDAVLQRIVEIAAEITGATYGALGVLAPSGDRLVEFVTTGVTPEGRAAIGDLPVGHGLLGLLITEAKPLRLATIGAHPKSVGFPAHHPHMTSLLGAPVMSRGRVFGNIYLTDKRAASEFSKEDEQILITLAAQAGVAIDNARLHAEALARELIVEAFREITTATLEGAGAAEALRVIGRRARELLGAATATVATPDVSGTLLIEVADGLHSGDLLGQQFPTDGSLSGRVIESGKPLVLEDAAQGEGYHPASELRDMGPMVLVPLIESGGRTFGTLSAINRRGERRFTDEDASLLGSLGNQAVLALEYARAQRGASRVAVLEDRERIAKELHDGVIQSLFAVGMGLEGTALISSDEQLAGRLEGAVGEIDRVIRDLRNYIFGLRPGILADRQLSEALRLVGDEFQQRSGVLTVVDVDDTIASELASSAADLLQVAREALSNVGRHAEAATCRLSLYRDDSRAVLELDDDGAGFDASDAQRGDGLSNIEQRAEAMRGTFSIESEPGKGTTLRLAVPLVSAQ
jgi:signal transduction histidine kinase